MKDENDVDITTLSPKGQVVIPGRIRRMRHLLPGSKFAVTATPEMIIFKMISVPTASEMLEEAIREGNEHAKRLGIKSESDVLKRMQR
ncbi:MAG: AbrB/MazE/SpoVT family DNA-binding domain-containing protein [Candidatus Micrarchaeota archaeon]